MLKRQLPCRIIKSIHGETASGIILLLSTLIALVLANSRFSLTYSSLLHVSFLGLSTLGWINDVLMAIFFFVVGLEIKREFHEGELSSLTKASLPFAAAAGGMIVPALIYLAVNAGTLGAPGWGIPIATDITFAIGFLSLLGKRISPALKVFLLALAIVDDVGAVLIIATFYTKKLHWPFLVFGLGILSTLILLNRVRIRQNLLYLLAGIPLWFCFHESGVHATVAGVLLAATMPVATGRRLESAMHPWVTFAVMPIFAFANAGVHFKGSSLFTHIGMGIVLGLMVGKPFGITLFSWLAIRLRIAVLPRQTSWRQMFGVACLGGIGFTMSIFIANLAMDKTLIEGAKIAVLTASLLAASIGVLILMRTARGAR